MSNIKRAICLFSLGSLLLLSSCKRSEPWWDADLVAPIAYSEMSLANLFADSLIQTNADSSLKIAFTSDLFNYKVDSLISIPDTSTNYYYPLGISIPYLTSTGQYFSFSNPPTTYNLNGVFLKKVLLRSGKIRVDVVSTVTPDFVYKINIPLTKLNAVPLLFIAPVLGPAIKGDTVKVTSYFDLSGYEFDLSGPAGNKTNYVETYAGVEFTEADSMHPGQAITTTITFQDLVPEYAQGYFGTQTVSVGPDTAAFDVFNQINSGMLSLNDASLSLKVINQFGADLRATVNSIKSLNLNSGNNVTLSGTPIASPFNVTRALQTGIPSNPVIPGTKNITLNGSNSNLVSFVNNLPGALSYAITAQLNPLGNVGGYNDFAYYGTSLKASMDVEIPLHFAASEITLKDTVNIDLTDVNQTENINRGTLTLIASNGYPFSVNLQGYLLNELGQKTDSLFTQSSLLNAPALDASFKVISPRISNLYIYLTPEKISKLKASKKIIFHAKFNTASYPTQVKFYDYYKLGLKLTADINYSINKK